jgi:hypothetical protein
MDEMKLRHKMQKSNNATIVNLILNQPTLDYLRRAHHLRFMSATPEESTNHYHLPAKIINRFSIILTMLGGMHV